MPSPGKDHKDGDFLRDLNKDSLRVVPGAVLEPSVARYAPGSVIQFERLGYFCIDSVDNTVESIANREDSIRLNRVVTLKDTWAGAAPEMGKRTSTKPSGVSGTATMSVGAPLVENDVLRVDLRVGRILGASAHPDADSLLVEQIDLGEPSGPRTIVSGLAQYYQSQELVGKLVVVVANLKPAKMRGIVSEGMVLCAAIEEVVILCFFVAYELLHHFILSLFLV